MKVHQEKLQVLADGIVAFIKKETPRAHATTLSLEGDLGAGKTTFVQHIAHALGVADTVPSPTFVIMRTYATSDPRFKRLVHIDAYRIEQEEELRPLHLPEIFADEETLVCVEWPKHLGSALPDDALHVSLEPSSEYEREVSLNPEIEAYLQGVGEGLYK